MLGNDTFTKLLLHGDGSDTSTTITDSSGSAHTVTANGNAQIDTAQSVFGGASILFDGTGDYLSIPDHDDWYLGTGAFTIDLRIRFNALPGSGGYAVIFNQRFDGTNYQQLAIANTAGVYTFVYVAVAAGVDEITVSKTITPSTGVWYHFAIVRTGNDFKMYQNGVQLGTTVTDASAVPSLAASLDIGRWSGDGYYLNGWIDEFRWSKGIARTDFIPLPTEAYNDSIVALPFISTGSMRIIEKVVAQPLVSTSSIVAPVVTGIIYAVLAPAVIEITGTCAAGIVTNADVSCDAPMATCEATTGATVECNVPMATCEATAFTNIFADVECNVPMATCEALSGAIVECDVPMATCEAEAMHHPKADVECWVPMATCEATATVGARADVSCDVPMAFCEAYAFVEQKANVECDVPMALCEAFAMVGAVAWVSCDVPMATLEAATWGDPRVDVELNVPMAICEATASQAARFGDDILQFARW